MKGVSGMMIVGIVSLVILVILLLTAGKGVGNIFTDKRAETDLAAMGLRNSIIQASLIDRGMAYYTMPESENYDVKITGAEISVQYAGTAISPYKPLVELFHYTPALVPKTLSGNEFCIVNKKDAANNCRQVVEVCLKKDSACCSFDSAAC